MVLAIVLTLAALVLIQILVGLPQRNRAGIWHWQGRSLAEASLGELRGYLSALTEGEWTDRHLEPWLAYYGFPVAGARACRTGTEGQRVFLVEIPATGTPKGTVVLLHGYMANAGHYAKLSSRLASLGWRVCLMDLPGHGLSDGPANCVEDFADYARALDQVMAMVMPTHSGGPVVAMGHSTGCAAWLEWLRGHPGQTMVQAGIFAAPLVRMSAWKISRQAARVVGPLSFKVPRLPLFSRKAIANPEFRAFAITADPLLSLIFDVRWVHALEAWNTRLEGQQDAVSSIPLLVLQGQGDTVVDWRRNMDALRQFFPHVQIREYPELCHNIIHERPGRVEAVWQELEAFLEGACRALAG